MRSGQLPQGTGRQGAKEWCVCELVGGELGAHPSGSGSPRRRAAARASMASRALRKRRLRCWFICG